MTCTSHEHQPTVRVEPWATRLAAMVLSALLVSEVHAEHSSQSLADDDLPRASVEVQRDGDSIIDPIVVLFTIETPIGWTVRTPLEDVQADDEINGLTATGAAQRTVTATDAGAVQFSYRLELQPFLPGSFVIGPFRATATAQQSDDAEQINLFVEQVHVEVTSAFADAQQPLEFTPSDIREPLGPAESRRSPILGIVALSGFAVLFVAVAWFIRSQRKQLERTDPEAALRALRVRFDELDADSAKPEHAGVTAGGAAQALQLVRTGLVHLLGSQAAVATADDLGMHFDRWQYDPDRAEQVVSAVQTMEQTSYAPAGRSHQSAASMIALGRDVIEHLIAMYKESAALSVRQEVRR